MRPIRIFLFGLSVMLLLCGLSIANQYFKLHLKGYIVKFPSISNAFKSTKPNYKDISHIIQLSTSLNDSVDNSLKLDTVDISPKKAKVNKDRNVIKADSVRTVFRRIEFPLNNDTVLYSFFDAISLAGSGKLIRVLHYGDSQIEGDRVTSYFRNQLQTKFGGGGIGLIPLVSANPASVSYMYEISDNWKKYSPLPGTAEDVVHKRYGALVNFARINQSTSLFGNDKELKGWIELKYPNISYPLAQQSQQCKLFYGYNTTPMMIELIQNKNVIDAEIVPPSSSLKEILWNIKSPRNLTISIKSASSPEVYGISLDTNHGIAVDNIPLRGSSGLEFTKIDQTFLRNFYQKLNVKMLILQFGVNIVPTVTSNYDYYEKSFYRQLVALKQTVPNLSIVVMGVSDVSRNSENGYESFPNIELIRDAQKKASFDAGCAFWDVFEAMGGHNSMPSWVFANPPLAQKDFVHFNPVGAKIIGEMFYRSFIYEYEQYLSSKHTDQVVAAVK
jgi:hypothetical protein